MFEHVGPCLIMCSIFRLIVQSLVRFGRFIVDAQMQCYVYMAMSLSEDENVLWRRRRSRLEGHAVWRRFTLGFLWILFFPDDCIEPFVRKAWPRYFRLIESSAVCGRGSFSSSAFSFRIWTMDVYPRYFFFDLYVLKKVKHSFGLDVKLKRLNLAM